MRDRSEPTYISYKIHPFDKKISISATISHVNLSRFGTHKITIILTELRTLTHIKLKIIAKLLTLKYKAQAQEVLIFSFLS